MDWTKIDLNHLLDWVRSLVSGGPEGLHGAGVWPLVAILTVSVVIGLYGERIAQLLILGIFISLGGLVGTKAAGWIALPQWPTVILMAALGGIFAFMLYRYALGLVLAVTLALAAGAWSMGSHMDRQEIADLWASVTSGEQGAAQAPAAEEPAVPNVPGSGEAMHYLQRVQGAAGWVEGLQRNLANRPDVQKHLVIMMLAGGAVGLLAGLVLGRIAAILLTSMVGGAGIVGSAAALSVRARPEWGPWASDNQRYLLVAAGVLALIFLLRQGSRRAPATAVSAGELAPSADKS